MNLIDLNLNELHCDPFLVSLRKFNGSCNNNDDLSSRTCVPNKTEHINLKAFNVIPRISESKGSTKQINMTVEKVIEIKSGTRYCVIVIAKINKKSCVLKSFIFGILVHVSARLINIHKVLVMT